MLPVPLSTMLLNRRTRTAEHSGPGSGRSRSGARWRGEPVCPGCSGAPHVSSAPLPHLTQASVHLGVRRSVAPSMPAACTQMPAASTASPSFLLQLHPFARYIHHGSLIRPMRDPRFQPDAGVPQWLERCWVSQPSPPSPGRLSSMSTSRVRHRCATAVDWQL